ncbi:MAG: epoxyqueuosine reductase QueH [Coriobacteriales bacterium]|nr:epoxyqueuosine reductase QueH [Coriobacteriales bacterium]
MNNYLLHICCAPCSMIPLRELKGEGRSPVAFYGNSNIQPFQEYEHRRATFQGYAEHLGLPLREAAYEPDGWLAFLGETSGIFPLVEGAPEYAAHTQRRRARCRLCYRYRFERLAAEAQRDGFETIGTTLSISPYQFTDLLEAELQNAAHRYGIQAHFVDYRRHYGEATRLSRAAELYRQNYCGCAFSQEEAELEREARKQARKQAREQIRAQAEGQTGTSTDATACQPSVAQPTTTDETQTSPC